MRVLSFFGLSIFNQSMSECVTFLDGLLQQNKLSRVVTVNPQMIVGLSEDKLMNDWLRQADLIIADGVGIQFGVRLILKQYCQINTGIQLVYHLLSQNKYSFYFVGATHRVIVNAVESVKRHYGDHCVVGYHHGYIEGSDYDDVIADIDLKRPDFVLVGMGFPKQEFFIQACQRLCHTGIAFGVGGVFDVLSGEKRYAPGWVRFIKCEWLYRGLQDPKKIKSWLFLIRYLKLIFLKLIRGRKRG